MNSFAYRFLSAFRSMLLGSSWLAVILAILCVISKMGVMFIIGGIFLVYAMGGFVISKFIKSYLMKMLKSEIKVARVNLDVALNKFVNKDSNGDEIIRHENKLYKKFGDDYRWIGNVYD